VRPWPERGHGPQVAALGRGEAIEADAEEVGVEVPRRSRDKSLDEVPFEGLRSAAFQMHRDTFGRSGSRGGGAGAEHDLGVPSRHGPRRDRSCRVNRSRTPPHPAGSPRRDRSALIPEDV
jgi:hypothetical protein